NVLPGELHGHAGDEKIAAGGDGLFVDIEGDGSRLSVMLADQLTGAALGQFALAFHLQTRKRDAAVKGDRNRQISLELAIDARVLDRSKAPDAEGLMLDELDDGRCGAFAAERT